MSLSGSRMVDTRRRRLLLDADADRTNPPEMAVSRKVPSESEADSSSFCLTMTTLIPRQLWKLWTAGFVGLLTITALWCGWWVAELGSERGSPVCDLVAPFVERLLIGAGAAAWWFTGQLCCVAWWIRSQSRVDYSGRYHAWGWSAAGFGITAGLCLTNAHISFAKILVHWYDVVVSPQTMIAIWLLPCVIMGLLMWSYLGAEFRDCRASRTLHGLAAISGLALIGLEIRNPGGFWETPLASRGLLLWLAWCNAMSVSMQLHQFIHVTVDPPAERHSGRAGGWIGKTIHSWKSHRAAKRQALEAFIAERLESEHSTSESVTEITAVSQEKRLVRRDANTGELQDVRIDDPEPAIKGPTQTLSRKAKKKARR